MTPGRSVLGRRDREREDPQMGRGLARWRDRRPGRLWRHTCEGGEVTGHRSGRVCQTDDKMAFKCIMGAAAATSGWSLGQRTTF